MRTTPLIKIFCKVCAKIYQSLWGCNVMEPQHIIPCKSWTISTELFRIDELEESRRVIGRPYHMTELNWIPLCWGYVKTIVCKELPRTPENMQQRIINLFLNFTPELLQRVTRSFHTLSLQENGRYIEGFRSKFIFHVMVINSSPKPPLPSSLK